MENLKAILISATKRSFWQHCKTLVDTEEFMYYILRKNVLFCVQ